MDELLQEKEREIQAKDELLQEKEREIQTNTELLQEKEREIQTNTELLQEKEREIQTNTELLQDKEREIQELQQRVREKKRSGVATGPLKLKWRNGPVAPIRTCGYSVAVSGDMVYCCDGTYPSTKVLMFNWRTRQWTVLPECPKTYFSIAVVNGTLTAIGGECSDKVTNTLLSLPDTSQHQWIKQFPPMKCRRNYPAVTTTSTCDLIVAGGWDDNTGNTKRSEVEVMNILTQEWSTVVSLPYPVSSAVATICGDRLYLGGGFGDGVGNPTKSVVMCEVRDLLRSRPQSPATRLGLSSSPPVWKEVASLPVLCSSLVTFQGQLLALGGSTTSSCADSTSEVRQYDATTNSWNVISQMRLKRRSVLVAALPNNTLIVCGGRIQNDSATNTVEVGSP